MTDQSTSPLPTPCDVYRDANGNVDMLSLIESEIQVIECAIDEAKLLTHGTAQLVVHALQLTNSHLRSALLAHKTSVAKPDAPTT